MGKFIFVGFIALSCLAVCSKPGYATVLSPSGSAYQGGGGNNQGEGGYSGEAPTNGVGYPGSGSTGVGYSGRAQHGPGGYMGGVGGYDGYNNGGYSNDRGYSGGDYSGDDHDRHHRRHHHHHHNRDVGYNGVGYNSGGGYPDVAGYAGGAYPMMRSGYPSGRNY